MTMTAGDPWPYGYWPQPSTFVYPSQPDQWVILKCGSCQRPFPIKLDFTCVGEPLKETCNACNRDNEDKAAAMEHT